MDDVKTADKYLVFDLDSCEIERNLIISFLFPSAGGVFGAAAQWSFLPHSGGVSGAAGEGVAVLRPQIQPAEQPESQQPGQRLHTHLPAVPGLRAPGEVLPPLALTAPATWLLSAFPPQLNIIHTDFLSSSHSSNTHRREGEEGEKFSCHYPYIWFSFALSSAGYVISTVCCSSVRSEAAAQMVREPSDQHWAVCTHVFQHPFAIQCVFRAACGKLQFWGLRVSRKAWVCFRVSLGGGG